MSDEILTNLYETIQAFWPLMVAVGVFIGLVMTGLVGVKLYQLTKTHQGSKGACLGLMFGGILLLNTRTTLTLLTNSILGTSPGEFGFSASVASGPAEVYLKTAIAAIKLVGFFGFVRGCYLLGQHSREGGSIWGGLIFMTGGVIALNLETFAIMLGNTLGGSIGATISALLQ